MRDSAGYDKVFKVLMVGDSSTGKPRIIAKFVSDNYRDTFFTTIGVDFHIKIIEHRSQRIKFQVWDTAGQERFRSLTTAYYRGSQGLFVVFDMTDRETFKSVPRWLEEIHANTKEQKTTIALLGNNCEDPTKHVVTAEEAEKLALTYNIPFLPVSSKTGINITEAFTNLVDSFYFPPVLLSKEEQHLLSTFKSGMLGLRQGFGVTSNIIAEYVGGFYLEQFNKMGIEWNEVQIQEAEKNLYTCEPNSDHYTKTLEILVELCQTWQNQANKNRLPKYSEMLIQSYQCQYKRGINPEHAAKRIVELSRTIYVMPSRGIDASRVVNNRERLYYAKYISLLCFSPDSTTDYSPLVALIMNYVDKDFSHLTSRALIRKPPSESKHSSDISSARERIMKHVSEIDTELVECRSSDAIQACINELCELSKLANDSGDTTLVQFINSRIKYATEICVATHEQVESDLGL